MDGTRLTPRSSAVGLPRMGDFRFWCRVRLCEIRVGLGLESGTIYDL